MPVLRKPAAAKLLTYPEAKAQLVAELRNREEAGLKDTREWFQTEITALKKKYASK